MLLENNGVPTAPLRTTTQMSAPEPMDMLGLIADGGG